jgi:hypothetical protein
MMKLVGTYGIPPWIGIAIGWAVCGSALWKGGWSERLVAAGFLANWIAVAVLKDHRFGGPQWAAFAIDTAYLGLIVFVAMKSGRYWPLFAAAFQLLAVVTHAASTIDRQLGGWAYITASVIWTYLLLGTLAIGTWNCARQQALAAGTDEPTL